MSGATAIRPIHIDEGDPFVLRTVRFDGVHAMPQDERSGSRPLGRPGVHRGANPSGRNWRWTRNIALAASTASPSCIRSRAALTAAPSMCRFTSRKVPQQRLRDVVTTGLARTRTSLVSRALKLDVGTPVDLAAWNAARRRLYQTGAFRSVDIQREVIEPATAPADSGIPPPESRYATVAVQEWPPFRLRLRHRAPGRARDGRGCAVDRQRQRGGGRTFGVGAAGDLGFRNLFRTGDLSRRGRPLHARYAHRTRLRDGAVVLRLADRLQRVRRALHPADIGARHWAEASPGRSGPTSRSSASGSRAAAPWNRGRLFLLLRTQPRRPI